MRINTQKALEGLMVEMPQHVAVIMDGNGRWARRRMLGRTAGHRAGSQALRRLAEQADARGIRYLSVYAFSTENWKKRPKAEVDGLMELLRGFIQEYLDDADGNNIRIHVIGRRDRLPPDLQTSIGHLEERTADRTGLTLVIALDYGSRDEIVRAAQKLAVACKEGTLLPEDITEEMIEASLDTAGIPSPDLLIRTSGEERISNFLLWQLAYSELYFTNKLWPDFTIDDLMEAVRSYNKRDRRFGG